MQRAKPRPTYIVDHNVPRGDVVLLTCQLLVKAGRVRLDPAGCDTTADPMALARLRRVGALLYRC